MSLDKRLTDGRVALLISRAAARSPRRTAPRSPSDRRPWRSARSWSAASASSPGPSSSGTCRQAWPGRGRRGRGAAAARARRPAGLCARRRLPAADFALALGLGRFLSPRRQALRRAPLPALGRGRRVLRRALRREGGAAAGHVGDALHGLADRAALAGPDRLVVAVGPPASTPAARDHGEPRRPAATARPRAAAARPARRRRAPALRPVRPRLSDIAADRHHERDDLEAAERHLGRPGRRSAGGRAAARASRTPSRTCAARA